jgi:hypothetical protein
VFVHDNVPANSSLCYITQFHDATQSEHAPSTPSPSQSGLPSPRVATSPLFNGSSGNGTLTGTPSKLSRPFVHPTISRLRSFTPRQTPTPSAVSGGSFGGPREVYSPAPSHFSAISRSSSLVNLTDLTTHVGATEARDTKTEREVYKWTRLRIIEDHIYARKPLKASAVLGTPSLGSPTVLTANGMVCVGTDNGSVFVFDFKQTLKCICGSSDSGEYSANASFDEWSF